jgi:hypothetical protein
VLAKISVPVVIRIVQGDQLLAEPRTTVWIEQASAAIRQIETQLPTPRVTSGRRRVTNPARKPPRSSACNRPSSW